ncbi:MAG: radical SAM protein [Archaeoglobus sp.]|uniref:B12-binding domain-containing radical SAM protein n=1 Tax=Archaeoglobus sp. TaxID=1872626 RepID=UPI001D893908|nr:radical SAM protein [Archaeoglobus sp.]MBO8180321.1 radical SAM protein [Archaeoglobus sp.]
MSYTISLVNPNAAVEVVKRLGISTPPLGLGYLAAALREKGFRVQIIDDLVEKLSFEKLVERLKNSEIVGITSTTATFNSALRYAKMIKEKLGAFVIMGGVHVTFRPFDALRHDFVDAVCMGEGEETIAEVAERVEAGKSLNGVEGVIYRDKGKIVDNGPRGFIEDLDSLPFPAFDLMPLEKYSLLGQKLEQFPMITSRGCPFACRYCSSSLFLGRRFRARSAKNVVDEMEWLAENFGAKHIAFGDDTFTLNRKRVFEICDEIKKRGLDVEWSCSSRVDTINEEMLRKMREAGCSVIYYGVESANKEILNKYYRKRIKLDAVKRAIEITKKVGIETVCSFIIGAPHETKKDVKETLKLAIKLNPDYAQFSILTPYPGTEIYEEAKEKGLILTENFDDYTAGKPVLKNLYMTSEEISKLLKHCYLRFYIRPSFIWKEIRKGRLKVVFEILKRAMRGEE